MKGLDGAQPSVFPRFMTCIHYKHQVLFWVVDLGKFLKNLGVFCNKVPRGIVRMKLL